MFTGLIEGRGKLLGVAREAEQVRLRIRADFAWDKPELGESVAVNGACLTVENFYAPGEFSVYASAKTMADTALGGLAVGDPVNLERALRLGDRLGGHLVSGHVDDVARVLSIRQDGESRIVRIGFDPVWAGQIIAKGSVALDGISLTINECASDWLEVNVIPETWKTTTMAAWKVGSRVNMETDLLGKYVENILANRDKPAKRGITLDFLQQNGF